MRSVLISIQPQWCEKIANKEKSIEVRKTQPKLELPFKCYIYCTAAAPYLVYGDVFDGGSFVERYTVTHGRSRQEADKIWGIMNGKVIGEFVCDNIRCFDVPYPAFRNEMDKAILEQSCLTYYQLHRYAYHDCLYAWHISDLVIYDQPKPLSEFRRPCINDLYCEECGMHSEYAGACGNVALQITRPPQSWFYVEELECP